MDGRLVSREQLEQALAHQREKGGLLGDILVGKGFLSEAAFLQFLAKEFNVLFISSDKLAKMTIASELSRLIPANMAKDHCVLPLQFKKKENTLFVAVNDPQNFAVLDEIKFSAGISKIKPVLSLTAPLRKMIAQVYGGGKDEAEISLGEEVPDYSEGGIEIGNDAPLELDRGLEPPPPPSPGRKASVDLAHWGDAPEAASEIGSLDIGLGAMPAETPAAVPAAPVELALDVPLSEVGEPSTKSRPRTEEAKESQRVLLVEPHPKVGRFLQRLLQMEGYQVNVINKPDNAVRVLANGGYDALVIQEKTMGYGTEFEKMVREVSARVNLSVLPNYGAALMGNTRQFQRVRGAFSETLDVIVGMLEMGKESFRGHTHLVAKYARLLAKKVELAEVEVDALLLAVHLHDLGVTSDNHRSLFSFEPDRDASIAEAPTKILTSVKFPHGVKEILLARFERWDGKGYPFSLKGEKIPVGARILAVAEAFQDLVTSGPGRKGVDRNEALQRILKAGGTLFDPRVAKLFLQVMEDEIKLGRIEGSAERVVLVDTDSELTTLVGMKFVNEGYRVDVYNNGQEAWERVLADPPDFIISEVRLPRLDGFSLCKAAKAEPGTQNIPFVFIGTEENADDVSKGLEAGADDFIVKPFKIDVLFTKSTRILERQRRVAGRAPKTDGVAGNLKEMGLPDMIQILSAGRKTGRIDVSNGGDSAAIFLEDGRIVNCTHGGKSGEEAFYEVIPWSEGTFTIVPNIEITERLIDKPNDSLILEGFRRFDESSRDGDEGEEMKLETDFL